MANENVRLRAICEPALERRKRVTLGSAFLHSRSLYPELARSSLHSSHCKFATSAVTDAPLSLSILSRGSYPAINLVQCTRVLRPAYRVLVEELHISIFETSPSTPGSEHGLGRRFSLH